MMKINVGLAVFNALCVPLNLWFYFYGQGLTLSLVVAILNAAAAIFCAWVACKISASYGDHGA